MYVANLADKTPSSKVTPSGIASTPSSKVTPPGITSTSSSEVASSGITSTPSSEVASSGITSSVASTKMSTTSSRPSTYTIPPSSSICKDCKSENSFKDFYVYESSQSSKTQLLSNHKYNDFTNHINHKYREIELQIERINDQISTVVNFIINHRNIICTLEQKITEFVSFKSRAIVPLIVIGDLSPSGVLLSTGYLYLPSLSYTLQTIVLSRSSNLYFNV